MRRLLVPAAVVALACAVFLAWMNPLILLPGNVGWLLDGHDRGQNAIGLAAYLRDAPPWPSTRQTLLSAPEGLTLLFTDSNPLLGLALRPFAAVLPPGLQFIGPWLLLCVLLQAAFAWALVRRWAPDTLTAWLGAALLTMMPVLINRYGHPNLCAHWLILWALWVFVDERRTRQVAWWIAVLGVAALVHSYLLLIVAAIWGSAVLRQLVVDPGRLRTVATAALALGTTAAIVSIHGVFGERFASTDTFGAFPMALDALWNPANPGFSALMPSSSEDQGRGFEGLQYLGVGLLLLVVVAIVTLVRRRGDRATRALLRSLVWLLPAFAVLTALALGSQWLWRGQPVMTVELSPTMLALLDPVRASGRLFWPVTYTITLVAVVVASRSRHALPLLAAAMALQAIDLAPMLSAVRATSASASDTITYRRTVDPRWRALVASASSIAFHPAEPFRDLALLEEIEWRAVLACRPVRFAYASRETAATRARLATEARDFAVGRIDPTRLYILFDPPPASIAARVRLLDGVRMIPPTAPAPPPRC